VECNPVGDTAAASASVRVRLVEWGVEPDVAEVAAGTVTLVADSSTAQDDHELVVVRADDPAALPVDDDGAVDEAALADGALVGEIEAFPHGTTCDGTFALDAGRYVLLCNLVETADDGTVESHFRQGMATTFTVT
jgi:hypothetical protein